MVFVDAETAEAVGVCEFAEALELIEGGGRVEFVGDFEKCHGDIIAAGKRNGAGVRTTAADSQQSTAYSLLQSRSLTRKKRGLGMTGFGWGCGLGMTFSGCGECENKAA